MNRIMMGLGLALAVMAGVATASAETKPPPPDALFNTVAALDARLFDAYNRCDLEAIAPMVAEDLEFYHDQTGLAVGRTPFVEALKTNICGKVRRELVPGTLEVHPLNNYGAVEIGVHRFCDPRKTNPCVPADSGEGKFVMLWRLKDGAWSLTRVISYDHVSSWRRAK